MTDTYDNAVREIRIGDEQAGQRIDNFLLSRLKGVPRSRIYRIVRTGEVRVNRGRIKPDYRLRNGDVVRVPPVRMGEPAQRGVPGEGLRRLVESSILFEDRGFIILNKPSGVAVHGGSGVSFGVIEVLRALRPDAPFLELGHRLDRDTSGCLLVAKKRSALRQFHDRLREGGVEKTYLALVRGGWRGGTRRIDAPLHKNVLLSGERVVRVEEDGKEALSIFEPVAITALASLMRVRIITGRTHQVRVHAAWSGYPIAGDEKYGDAPFNRAMAERGLRRLFLHAAELRFTPSDGTTLAVSAPLEPALLQILEQLKANHGNGI